MNLVFALALNAAIGAAGPDAYSTAFHQAEASGKPLVVLVGADWCPGCRSMKDAVVPQLRKQGSLDKVSFAIVNTDQDRELAGKLMVGGSIPQLIVYRKTASGWTRNQMTGAHSVGEVESFIGQPAETPAKVSSLEDSTVSPKPAG